ncbi:MAG: L-threonylcarbamoyladenylate synthase [Dehalococcoidales bacterium]|nr:L-threonylcarbamoyladenylate synthase [Dehalococcoidales bacterium]
MPARIEQIDAQSPSPLVLQKAADLLRRGEVIVSPTDTGYAFSANAVNVDAIAKVFNLKGRSFNNPIHIAVDSLQGAEKYARINKTAEYLAAKFLPGALTIVLPKKDPVPSLLVAGLDTVGIRIPNNPAILGLVRLTGFPLTTTSANISGKPAPYEVGEIIEQFGADIENIALILDQGKISPPEVSTIVDLTVDPPRLLRQGRIPLGEIQKALKENTSGSLRGE